MNEHNHKLFSIRSSLEATRVRLNNLKSNLSITTDLNEKEQLRLKIQELEKKEQLLSNELSNMI